MPVFQGVLGVETMVDVHYVVAEDLTAVGLKPVQARRFMRLVANLVTVSVAPSLARLDEPHCVPPSIDPVDAPPVADDAGTAGGGDSCVVGRSTEGADDGHADAEEVSIKPAAKRRRQTRRRLYSGATPRKRVCAAMHTADCPKSTAMVRRSNLLIHRLPLARVEYLPIGRQSAPVCQL